MAVLRQLKTLGANRFARHFTRFRRTATHSGVMIGAYGDAGCFPHRSKCVLQGGRSVEPMIADRMPGRPASPGWASWERWWLDE
jgi:hypothetical protein